MKAELSVLLSGLGYYRLSEQRRRILWIVLGASLGIHLAALLAFGSWVMIRSLREERTVFTAPPPLKTYEPRKLEHRVKVQKRQRSSSRPQITPRLVANRLASLALPEIKTDPKVIHTTFQPKFKAVSGAGLGAGLGTGLGLSGFGQGVSAFDFFGIRGRGNRIAILVDVSVSMVEEERGGPEGYLQVKNRIGQVVDALNRNALFNVVVFADAAQTFQPGMVVANEANKEAARLFVQGYNTSFANSGLTSGNVQASDLGLTNAVGGETRLDLALTAAFQQGADTVLIISDGIPRVERGLSDEEKAAWRARMERWTTENQAAMEAYQQWAAGPIEYVEEKVWVPPKAFREGGGPARAGHWEVRKRPKRQGARRPQPPKLPKNYWTFQDFVQHFSLLQEQLYTVKGKKPPVVHCIGYAIDKDGGSFLKGLARQFKGNYRRVAKI